MSNDFETLRQAVADAKAAVEAYEIDVDDPDVIARYEEMLNEVHGTFMGMDAAHILKECDPVAYRCGMNDYVDGLDKEDFDAYKALTEALEEAESALSDAEDAEGVES